MDEEKIEKHGYDGQSLHSRIQIKNTCTLTLNQSLTHIRGEGFKQRYGVARLQALAALWQ
jgi:hypothetical protein